MVPWTQRWSLKDSARMTVSICSFLADRREFQATSFEILAKCSEPHLYLLRNAWVGKYLGNFFTYFDGSSGRIYFRTTTP